MKKKHKHKYIYSIHNGGFGFACKKCGKKLNLKVAFTEYKVPFLGYVERAGRGMKKHVDKYLDKVFSPENIMTGTIVGSTGPSPKVGDTITMGAMKYKVTKILNKRKSREFEYVMKRILEQQYDLPT